MVSWHVFEKPINGLKDRFAYADKRRIAQAAEKPEAAGSFALPKA
jgi:peptidoglycan/LPS O-acetylase OafA/YrhL